MDDAATIEGLRAELEQARAEVRMTLDQRDAAEARAAELERALAVEGLRAHAWECKTFTVMVERDEAREAYAQMWTWCEDPDCPMQPEGRHVH